MHKAIGLDFGTTNSAIALATPDGTARLADFQAGAQRTTTCRSVLYFSPENIGPGGKPYAIAGPRAIRSYLEADAEGRLIQSMKSHVASRLFTHTTLFACTFTIEELISVIIRELRTAAEEQFGERLSVAGVGAIVSRRQFVTPLAVLCAVCDWCAVPSSAQNDRAGRPWFYRIDTDWRLSF